MPIPLHKPLHAPFPYKLMILPSQDGQEYTAALLYPAEWVQADAERLALAIFESVQRADPEEWSWDDYEPALLAAGFIIPPMHFGPVWD
jgi:hypothetical protein